MGKVSFGSKWGRVQTKVKKDASQPVRSVEEVVRELKKNNQKPPGEDYREQSLRIHGLVCARCGREFDATNRQLLTVHHKEALFHAVLPSKSTVISSSDITAAYSRKSIALSGRVEKTRSLSQGISVDQSFSDITPLPRPASCRS